MKQKTPNSAKTSRPPRTQSKKSEKTASSAKKLSRPSLEPEVLPAESEEKDELDEQEELTSQDADDDTLMVEPEEGSAYDPSSQTALSSSSPSLETEVTAIAPHDPLKRYLEDLKKYPLLEAEEEYALAIRLRDQGDLEAAKALVSANLRLVVKIAFEYRTYYSNLLDLIQEGNIGLMKAVSKFDPTKGARLGYYASWWIRSYILKYLLDNFRLVKVGTTQAQKKLFYHLMREKEKLEAQGMLAGPKLLAEKLNVREKDVIEMEQRLSGQGVELSLEAPIETSEGKATSHKDLLVDQKETTDEALARQELIQILKEHLPEFQKMLNEKEKKILNDRLLAEDPKTLQEVADNYGLTRERARQIEAKVVEKLRLFLKPFLGNWG